MGNGMIIVAVAALIGGRAYHVIDQWALYQDDPIKIFLPPYSGLGVYGGIVTGTIAAFAYARYKKVPFLRWADIIAPGAVRDAGHRPLGQLLQPGALRAADDVAVGDPDRLRAPGRRMPVRAGSFPARDERFHPLFLYESISGSSARSCLSGSASRSQAPAARRPAAHLLRLVRDHAVRARDPPRDNWTFFGVPTAQIVSLLFVIPALVILFWRHRPRPSGRSPATHPEGQTWGAPGSALAPDELDDEDETTNDEEDDDEEDDDDETRRTDDDADEVLDVEALNATAPSP